MQIQRKPTLNHRCAVRVWGLDFFGDSTPRLRAPMDILIHIPIYPMFILLGLFLRYLAGVGPPFHSTHQFNLWHNYLVSLSEEFRYVVSKTVMLSYTMK